LFCMPLYQNFHIKIPEDSDYVTFLATVSGIAGVFIGLYYAAISTVGGAIYSRVPNNIRDLLARERIGNVYMRFLAFLTCVTLSLIGLRILGFPRIFMAIPFIILLSGIGIIAFVKLGTRAFYLFDPTRLSYSIFDDLRHWLKIVCAKGYRWDDKSFQAHANKQAMRGLETLQILADISGKEPHLNGRPYAELIRHIIGFLVHYQKIKARIPSESLWYEQRYKQQDWYTSSETVLTLAHETGTQIHPEIVNNRIWIEEKLIPIILDCISANLKERRFNLVLELLQDLQIYLNALAEKGSIKYALEILEKIGFQIFEEIRETEQQSSSKETLEHLGLTEYIFLIPITILLSYLESIKYLNKKEFSKRMAQIQWQTKADIYLHNFNEYSLPRLEWLKTRLNFEIAVEDSMISPPWYITELLLQVEAEKLTENLDCFLSIIPQFYNKTVEKMNSAKYYWLASAIISREWEYFHKMRILIRELLKIWSNIGEKKQIEKLEWPELDIELKSKQVRDGEREVLKLMSAQNALLLFLTRPADFIDYGGQFLHTIGEAILNALCESDVELLRTIFKSYFYGCLTKFDHLRPKEWKESWASEQELKIAAAPLLDVMEMSGYARLMSDYHKNSDLWMVVMTTWDEYMGKKDASQTLKLLTAAIALTETPFEIPHRGVIRTRWKSIIENCLAKLPKRRVFTGRISMDEIILHESPLVRIFAREHLHNFRDGIDIFLSFYVKQRPEAKDLSFTRNRRDLMETIVREEEFYNNATGSEGAD